MGEPLEPPSPYWVSDEGDVTLYLGKCEKVLAGFDSASFDAIVTDPPYGLEFMGAEWDTFRTGDGFRRSRNEADAGRDNVFGRTSRTSPEYVSGQAEGRFAGDLRHRNFKGFVLSQQRTRNVKCPDCGKWAYDHPGRLCECGGVRRAQMNVFQEWCEAWAAECLRVLKPGGWMLCFGGTRTWHRLTCAIEDAGFEIADGIAELIGQDAPGLMWIHGQGFPKSKDAARAVDMHVCVLPGRHCMRKVPDDPKPGDHVCPESEQGEPWRGWGTAAKPAWEPVVVARKPLAGTLGRNLLEHGVGALNIDGCRVEGGSRPSRSNEVSASGLTGTGGAATYGSFAVRGSIATGDTTEGRWPPNIVLVHSADCQMIGMREVRSDGHHPASRGPGGVSTSGHSGQDDLTERRSGSETVTAWHCVPGCPAAELDRQSGVLTSGANPTRRSSDKFRDAYGDFAGQEDCIPARGAESGGASRFLPAFKYEAKAPSSERPRLPDGTAWPTVKPLDLISYLVRWVTPPGGLVLDPFGGSGTTAEACIVEGFRCLLIDKDPKAAELIKTRLSKPIQPVLFGDLGEAS